eukprot:12304227-Alexandrium_andersonii.AAC.1
MEQKKALDELYDEKSEPNKQNARHVFESVMRGSAHTRCRAPSSWDQDCARRLGAWTFSERVGGLPPPPA